MWIGYLNFYEVCSLTDTINSVLLTPIYIHRVKAPNVDPQPKADLLEVIAPFVTLSKTL